MNVTNIGTSRAQGVEVSMTTPYESVNFGSFGDTVHIGDIEPGETVLTPINVSPYSNPSKDTLYTSDCFPGNSDTSPSLTPSRRHMDILMRRLDYPRSISDHLPIRYYHSSNTRRRRLYSKFCECRI
jgi:hypothetical protein